jgi:peptide chain release factor subunit 1
MSEDKPKDYQLNSKEKHKLKAFVKELDQYRGRHTELVSVYVPTGYDLTKITQHLEQEKDTASNIKSSTNRKNVQDALEKMIQHLKTVIIETPENGLAVFSGNVAEREGQQDFNVWAIEPPAPMNQRLYRCDKEFVLDPLKEMLDDKNEYGLVVLDGRDATIAVLRGKTIIPLKTTHSEVPGKMRAGGQSAPRFQRLRAGALNDHFKKIARYMKDEFLPKQYLKGIIIGGPGTTVNSFINKHHLTGDVEKKVIGTKDLSYTGMYGLQELVDKSEDILAKEEVIYEKKLMKKFFKLLSTEEGKTAYGLENVMKLVKQGVVDTVILSEVLNDKTIDKFEEEAAKMGTNVELVSLETTEGVQLRDMGKVVAILRFAIES